MHWAWVSKRTRVSTLWLSKTSTGDAGLGWSLELLGSGYEWTSVAPRQWPQQRTTAVHSSQHRNTTCSSELRPARKRGEVKTEQWWTKCTFFGQFQFISGCENLEDIWRDDWMLPWCKVEQFRELLRCWSLLLWLWWWLGVKWLLYPDLLWVVLLLY